MPVGKPAPPRPRSPEVFTSSTTSSGDIDFNAFSTARYPPFSRYTWKALIPGTSMWVNNSLRAIVNQLSILMRYSSASRRFLFQFLDQFVYALFGQVFVEC